MLLLFISAFLAHWAVGPYTLLDWMKRKGREGEKKEWRYFNISVFTSGRAKKRKWAKIQLWQWTILENKLLSVLLLWIIQHGVIFFNTLGFQYTEHPHGIFVIRLQLSSTKVPKYFIVHFSLEDHLYFVFIDSSLLHFLNTPF